MRKTGLFMLAIFAFASCNSTKKDLKTNTTEDSYFVFGKFHGHCQGNCAHLFKLHGNQLLADDIDRFTDWEELKFKPEPLSNSLYQAAQSLLKKFPKELWNAEGTIGCPDCADQGGYAIETRKDGKLYHWRIDTNRNDVPDYLQPYLAKIDAVMDRIK